MKLLIKSIILILINILFITNKKSLANKCCIFGGDFINLGIGYKIYYKPSITLKTKGSFIIIYEEFDQIFKKIFKEKIKLYFGSHLSFSCLYDYISPESNFFKDFTKCCLKIDATILESTSYHLKYLPVIRIYLNKFKIKNIFFPYFSLGTGNSIIFGEYKYIDNVKNIKEKKYFISWNVLKNILFTLGGNIFITKYIYLCLNIGYEYDKHLDVNLSGFLLNLSFCYYY